MKKTLTSSILVLYIFFFGWAEARTLPDLSPNDVHEILEEIFATHATYHEMTPLLVQRSLQNYVEALDPFKTYFLKTEIEPLIQPSEAICIKILEEFKKGEFSAYETILLTMKEAISRRHSFEERLLQTELPLGIKSSEFKDLAWCETEDALFERLLKIRALQAESAEKLSPEDKARVVQLIAKRRQKAEEEISPNTPEELKQLVYTHVLKAIASSLDTHTAYYTPTEAAQFMIQVQQRLFGIGVQIRDDINGFTFVRLLEGGPAAEDKLLKAGDKVIAINGETVIGLDIEEVVERIRGPEGTTVHLTLLREHEEEKLEVDVKRREIILKETRYEVDHEPFGDGVLGHIKLFSFYQDPNNSSASDLREAISNLKQEHKLKGLILDLRYNAGGLLPQAVSVAGLFINKGIVASIKEHNGALQHLRDVEGNPVWEGPLIILISKGSASSAEIVAQTLQDYGRAIIVGDPESFGKGTFQTFTLDSCNSDAINPKGEFKVTRGRYYTVSGKSPQLTGVKADIPVPGPLCYAEIGEQYAKYPLENDQILPHFIDTLEDIPLAKRKKICWLYQCNQQQKLSVYTQYLNQLLENSKKRVEKNKHYQKFLTILKAEEESEECDTAMELDFQYIESIQILKDLLSLMH